MCADCYKLSRCFEQRGKCAEYRSLDDIRRELEELNDVYSKRHSRPGDRGSHCGDMDAGRMGSKEQAAAGLQGKKKPRADGGIQGEVQRRLLHDGPWHRGAKKASKAAKKAPTAA